MTDIQDMELEVLNIVSKGQQYDIYNNTKKFNKGIVLMQKLFLLKHYGLVIYYMVGFGLQDLTMMMLNGNFLESQELT